MQYMRNVDLKMVRDPAVLAQPMTLLTADIESRGAVTGSGAHILIDHDGNNALASLRFKLRGARMLAAEADFSAGGRDYAAGTFILPSADRATVERVVAELGLSAQAVDSLPSVATHPLTVPRIAVMHSWQRTQDDGWWRVAFDHYGIPFDYVGDIEARKGRLRDRYDVIVYPTAGGTALDAVTGVPKDSGVAIPYQKTAATPNLGVLDQAADIRGGLGVDGLAELRNFVASGGTLIGDGSTVEALVEYGIAPGVTVTRPPELYSKGAIMRGVFTDKTSPLTYGYAGSEMPIYFSQAPVLGLGRSVRALTGNELAQNITPNAVINPVEPLVRDPAAPAVTKGGSPTSAVFVPGQWSSAVATAQPPRTIMQFPANADDILLSSLLEGGSALVNRPLMLDVAYGRGHMVLYALRPFWRSQTQGSYFLGFNAILNWDHLDAGAAPKPAAPAP